MSRSIIERDDGQMKAMRETNTHLEIAQTHKERRVSSLGAVDCSANGEWQRRIENPQNSIYLLVRILFSRKAERISRRELLEEREKERKTARERESGGGRGGDGRMGGWGESEIEKGV